MGDSKLVIFHIDNGFPFKVFETEDSVHSFNTPYQLCKIPTKKELEVLFKEESTEKKN